METIKRQAGCGSVIVHQAEEGGYWAKVPAIPGCATQGETFGELLQNLCEAAEGCQAVDVESDGVQPQDRVLEIAVRNLSLAANRF